MSTGAGNHPCPGEVLGGGISGAAVHDAVERSGIRAEVDGGLRLEPLGSIRHNEACRHRNRHRHLAAGAELQGQVLVF